MEPVRRWRLLKIATAVMVVLVLLAGGGLAWLGTRDLSTYQARIVDEVRKVTGRELAAKGKLRVNWSWRPSAVAENVTLSNAAWGTRREMVTVKRITVHLDLATLLLGELKIGRIELEGADVLIERNANGESNLEMAPAPQDSGPHASEHRSLRLRGGPVLPWVGVLDVSNSMLTIAGTEGRGPLVLGLERAVLSAANITAPLQGTLAARIDGGIPFELKGAFGSFEGWLKGVPGKLDARGTLGGGTLAIEGSVTTKGTTLTLKADGPDLSALNGFARLPLPQVGPFEASAKAATTPRGFKIEIPTLRVGTSQATGEIAFRTDRFGRRIVSATFDSPKIDLADFQRPPQMAAPAPAPPPVPGTAHAAQAPAQAATGPARPAQTAAVQGDRRLLSSDPLPIDLLQQWNGSLTVKVGEIVGPGVKVTSAGLSVGLSGGRLTARPSGTVGSGSATVELLYDVSGKNPSATLSATMNRVSLQELLALAGAEGVLKDTVSDLELRLRGTGRSIRDLVVTSTGTIEGSGGPGALLRDHAAFIASDWRRISGAADVSWNCAALRAEVTGGTAHIRRLVMDLPKAVVIGGGYVHSRSETLELLVAPEARETALIPVAVPLRIKAATTRSASETDLAAAKGIHLFPAKVVPSLTGQMAQLGKVTASGGNACGAFAQKLDGLRPNLRSQLPTPPTAAPERGRRTR
jgi:uncharacterized protein involved in outer membrane biogenesis